MNNQLIPFAFEAHECPVIIDELGNPWWIARVVCDILELENITKAMERLDEDEKLIRKLFVSDNEEYLPALKVKSGQTREVWTINESGLWSLILRSNKPEARRLKKWVTSEVLPSIRKTGHYGKRETPVNPAARSRYVLFNQPDCAIKLEQMNNAVATGALTAEGFNRILFEEAAPPLLKVNTVETAIDRFFELNVFFVKGSSERLSVLHKRFEECGGPYTLTDNKFAQYLVERIPGLIIQPRRFTGHMPQICHNVQLTKNPVSIGCF
jgi:Prophage antirepressor